MHGPTGEIVGGIVALLLLAAATLAAATRLRFPFSIALLLLGMALARFGELLPATEAILGELTISADLILFVFLPTLVFESAFHLDWRQLRRNLAPVLTLAVPGLLLSSLCIAGLLRWGTGMSFAHAWLLGSILSATDPVAVIALFKKLGAPQRLTILVEGESLFNDATAIVLSRILVGIAASGVLDSGQLVSGAGDFFVVFFGGILVGWLLAEVIVWLLSRVHAEAEIEITLTTVLAYLSFLLAEELLHVSGVMATVTAGLLYGHRGWMSVSTSVRAYLEHFWEYMAFVATALIFLMVGLSVDVASITAQWHALLWLIFGMLASRALVIYGLVPWINRLPGAEPVGPAYQSVMYWGGLRGAIALAIVLSLPDDLPFKEDFIALVAGALLFTLLVQGLTINTLVRALGLDRQPLLDRFGIYETRGAMAQRVLQRLPELRAGGLFSSAPLASLQEEYSAQAEAAREELDRLQSTEFQASTHRDLLGMRVLAEERQLFSRLFDHGHIAERVMRQLVASNAEAQDAVRQGHPLPARRLPIDPADRWTRQLNRLLPMWREHRARRRLASEYQAAWVLYQSSRSILGEWDGLLPDPTEPAARELRDIVQGWEHDAHQSMDQTAEQFPEFAAAMQQRHAQRLARLAELDVIDQRQEHGSLCASAAGSMRRERLEAIAALRDLSTRELQLDPAALLRQVPLFHAADDEVIQELARAVQAWTLEPGAEVIRQNAPGDSLFLLARGVVRVEIATEQGAETIATLMAGDFFGESALLHQTPRTATVRTVTPCTLYELKRPAFLQAAEKLPSLAETAAAIDRERQAELAQLGEH